MKTLVTHAVILISLTGVAALFASASTDATENDNRTEEEIRRLNVEEAQAFLHKDSKSLARLWSDDLVVTHPLNKFVTKQQVLEMVESGFLVITVLDRQIEYVRVYGDSVIVAGREKASWGGKMPNAGRCGTLPCGLWELLEPFYPSRKSEAQRQKA